MQEISLTVLWLHARRSWYHWRNGHCSFILIMVWYIGVLRVSKIKPQRRSSQGKCSVFWCIQVLSSFQDRNGLVISKGTASEAWKTLQQDQGSPFVFNIWMKSALNLPTTLFWMGFWNSTNVWYTLEPVLLLSTQWYWCRHSNDKSLLRRSYWEKKQQALEPSCSIDRYSPSA